MKLPRPYIPLDVRRKVARRQISVYVGRDPGPAPLSVLLRWLSKWLGSLDLHLDHDPALCNRKFSKRTGKYIPDANDPRFLVYRTKAAHDQKTRVRGDAAQLSDLALRRKNKRIAKRILTGKRPRYGGRQNV